MVRAWTNPLFFSHGDSRNLVGGPRGNSPGIWGMDGTKGLLGLEGTGGKHGLFNGRAKGHLGAAFARLERTRA